LKLLTDVSRSIPGVEKEPAPAALFLGFGENALNFELRYWLQVGTPPEVESNVALAVASEFRKAGIEVPFPQRDLYLKSVTTDIALQPASESKHSGLENADLLPLPPPKRIPATDPISSTLRKSKDSGR